MSLKWWCLKSGFPIGRLVVYLSRPGGQPISPPPPSARLMGSVNLELDKRMNRRRFLKNTGVAAGVTAVHNLVGANQGVSIIVDPRDTIASAPPPAWAVGELRAALRAQGVAAQVYPRMQAAPAGHRCIVVAGGSSPAARPIPKGATVAMPA